MEASENLLCKLMSLRSPRRVDLGSIPRLATFPMSSSKTKTRNHRIMFYSFEHSHAKESVAKYFPRILDERATCSWFVIRGDGSLLSKLDTRRSAIVVDDHVAAVWSSMFQHVAEWIQQPAKVFEALAEGEPGGSSVFLRPIPRYGQRQVLKSIGAVSTEQSFFLPSARLIDIGIT